MRTRRQALGQHFLADPAVVHALVELIAPGPDDLVVEIGPGRGALTAALAARAGRLVAIERDRHLAADLRGRFPGVDTLDGDARAWDWSMFSPPPGGRLLVAGNLPYSVGTAIVLGLLPHTGIISALTVMLQREVAERLAAGPGGRAYGSLSLHAQAEWDVRIALRVPARAFAPPPEVESAVVRLVPLAAPRVLPPERATFEAVVRAAFGRRRKTVANALAAGLGASAETVRGALADLGIDPRARAETLALEAFVLLARRLEKLPSLRVRVLASGVIPCPDPSMEPRLVPERPGAEPA